MLPVNVNKLPLASFAIAANSYCSCVPTTSSITADCLDRSLVDQLIPLTQVVLLLLFLPTLFVDVDPPQRLLLLQHSHFLLTLTLFCFFLARLLTFSWLVFFTKVSLHTWTLKSRWRKRFSQGSCQYSFLSTTLALRV